MDLLTMATIVITLLIMGGAIWLFVYYVKFVVQDIGPKIMTGRMTPKEYFSLAAGFMIMLVMLAFGPYYMAQAIKMGWDSVKPLTIQISEEAINDFVTIINGGRLVPNYDNGPEFPVNSGPVPTAIPPMTAPTATPFTYDNWSPDQPVPTPNR